MKEGSKYQPLQDYLRGSKQEEVILTLPEIEEIMNDTLPKSAWTKKAWWSNRTKGAWQSLAWMEVGYRVENIDLERETITFRQPPQKYEVEIVDDTVLWNGELIKALRRHMGLTQAEFAKKLGVRQTTISQWESNNYQIPLSMSKYLELVASTAKFQYKSKSASS